MEGDCGRISTGMTIGSIVHLLLGILLLLLGAWLAWVCLYIGGVLARSLVEIALLNLIDWLAIVCFFGCGRRVIDRDRCFVFLSRLFVGRQRSA
jgi:hypothetical protein